MTKTVQLTKGKTALVDDADYERLNQRNWNAHFNWWKWYAVSNGEKMHRVIMGVTDPSIQVDHINGNSLDNRRCNLRVATMAENQRNRGKNKNNKSGFKGVYWDKQAGKWHAHITVDNKKINLGLYADPVDGAKAYNAAALKYHGPFAWLNPIPSSPSR